MNILDSRHMRQTSIIERCKNLPLKIYRFETFLSMTRRRGELNTQLAVLQIKLKNADDKLLILNDLADWISNGLVLERATNSAIHRFQEAVQNNQLHHVSDTEPLDFPVDLLSLHSFVVEHDLASAFARMENFESGEFEAPYDCTLFEFQLSGKRVILLMQKHENNYWTLLFVETSGLWFTPNFGYILGTDLADCPTGDAQIFRAIYEKISSQVRAICIALDARIATEEIVRAPTALNKIRARSGKLPLIDYSIIKLMHRSRYEALPSSGEEEHAKRRLHFVRGHWRHFETHKTWIKWFLRGDPDLGFIEKEYRL